MTIGADRARRNIELVDRLIGVTRDMEKRLTEMEKRIDRLEEKISRAVVMDDLVRLGNRVDGLERRVRDMSTPSVRADKKGTKKRKSGE